jgi:hypothetical protein
VEAAALGPCAAKVRRPCGWPHPVGAPRHLLAQLGGHVFAGPGTSTDALLHETGIKVGGQVLRYASVTRPRPGEDPSRRQQWIYGFENNRTFRDFVGDLPEDAEALFRPTVVRSAADPHEISAGAGSATSAWCGTSARA